MDVSDGASVPLAVGPGDCLPAVPNGDQDTKVRMQPGPVLTLRANPGGDDVDRAARLRS